MREVKRIYTINPRGALRRAADGRLKAASEGVELADVWAEQHRLRLKQAIDDDQRRAQKKQRRRERGLFGRRTKAQPLQSAASSERTQRDTGPRQIEINVHMPQLHLKSLFVAAGRLLRSLLNVLKAHRRWSIAIATGLVILLGAPYAVNMLFHRSPRAVEHASSVSQPVGGTQPDYATILPRGKTIQQLGGWGRVSPPNAAPAFGYSDMLSGVHIVVSEQQLPSNFAANPDSQLAQVAKQFGSSEKLTASDGTVVYLGAASSGAQSAVASKSNLLLLIRSSSKIADHDWLSYLNSLQ